jgi:hypothetical protein
MSKSIAGAKYTGHLAERYVAKSKLSQFPCTILDIDLAVNGAINIKSAQIDNSTWLFQVLVSESIKSNKTSFSDNVES